MSGHTNTLRHLIFGAVLSTAAITASATQTTIPNAATRDLTSARRALLAQQAQSAVAHAAAQNMTASARAALPPGTAAPAEIFVNSYRAYPPSCLNDGVPFGTYANDSNRVQKQVTLIGDPLSGDVNERNYTENVTITLWRVACTSGKSATVLEIDRTASAISSGFYPVLPNIYVPFSDGSSYVPRLADDPNTFLATNYALSPLLNSDSYVFENQYGVAPSVDYNAALTIVVDNFLTGTTNDLTTFSLPAYNPSQYAAASQPLSIGGYQSGAWYDPAHGGEGMLIQVYDNGDQKTRTFYAQWFTYDASGLPFWLVAQATINIGDNKVTNAVTQYLTGGGFAGAVKANNRQTWGAMSFQFSDCNTLQFTYSGQTDAATNGPAGTGARTWNRLGNINGLVCGP